MKTIFIVLFVLSVTGAIAQPKEGVDYLGILQRSAVYDLNEKDPGVHFTYQSSNNPSLKALRKNFNLDSIAGFGNEVSRLLNLLHWVHNTVKHNGTVESGIKEINANEILNTAITKGTGVSCGELATTLNDCYLAMGWNSRKIYCFPRDSMRTDMDSHVINIVYLSSQHKWIWVDPTNDAYVMNEKGQLLSIEEVRQGLIDKKFMIVNPDANWNHKSSMTKDFYLDIYMAKNLYRMYCPLNSEYDYETAGKNDNRTYVSLVPAGADDPLAVSGLKRGFKVYTVHDPGIFWQVPGE